MTNKVSKLNPEGITESRQYFLDFLELTNFPHLQRNGTREGSFDYPEWLIMFVAVLAVKCREKTYLGIHRMTEKYGKQIAVGLDLPVISESQLRERLKKSTMSLESQQVLYFKSFLENSSISEASDGKMMVKAKGGKVWHKKAKESGEIPEALTGLDQEATWSHSKAAGWIYGHGAFCLTSHTKSVVGLFIWMPNSAHEAFGTRDTRICRAFRNCLYGF